jgi:hypothetical protein
MASAVRWRLLFRVANRAALDRCLGRVLRLLGEGAVAGEGMPYWKDPGLWECGVACPVPAGSVAECVLGCLLAAQRLASGWYILGSLSADRADSFGGVFAADQSGSVSKVPGLEWASFEVVPAVPAEQRAAADGGRELGS